MIHNAYNKSVIAQLYYRQQGKKLEPQPAIKKFIQDQAIDAKVLVRVFEMIIKEQRNLLK